MSVCDCMLRYVWYVFIVLFTVADSSSEAGDAN